MTTDVCKMCGESFAKHGNQKYCSKECRRAAIRQMERKRYLEWVKPKNEKKKSRSFKRLNLKYNQLCISEHILNFTSKMLYI